MNIREYISSGILETYCLGLVSDSEQEKIEALGKKHPEVQAEIDKIFKALEKAASKNAVEPPKKVKLNLMLHIYEMESGPAKKYPPLIKEHTDSKDFSEWLKGSRYENPDLSTFENIFMQDLPSTEQVTNFMVWAKQGHDDEEHNDFLEYIVILKGHCDMYFDNEKKHFNEGDIIRIPKDVTHHAIITSEEPMVAIVQRVAA